MADPISLAFTVASTVLSMAGASSQADNMRRVAEANAENARRAALINKQQTDHAAGQAEAAGQHEAEAKRRKAELMLSRAQAIAAASGGGPLDETLMNGILEEGEKDAGYSLYEGSERGKGLRYKGDLGVYEANQQGRAGIKSANRQADATIMGGLANAGLSMASAFAPGPAPGAPAIRNSDFTSVGYENSFDNGSMNWAYRR